MSIIRKSASLSKLDKLKPKQRSPSPSKLSVVTPERTDITDHAPEKQECAEPAYELADLAEAIHNLQSQAAVVTSSERLLSQDQEEIILSLARRLINYVHQQRNGPH